MGQKVNPTGYRTGVFLGWKSRWYASKKEFAELLVEDAKIRKFIKTRTATTKDNHEVKMYPMISKIEIERTRDAVKLILFSGRARDLTRNEGKVIQDLTDDLQNLIGRKFQIEVREIRMINKDAQLVAEDIGNQLVNRASFRRVMKHAMETAMKDGAKGIKIQLSGRLGGAEMSRTETTIQGSIPLSTLRANIDYGFYEAKIAQGHIGIQVWINNGEYGDKQEEEPEARPSRGPRKSYKRG